MPPGTGAPPHALLRPLRKLGGDLDRYPLEDTALAGLIAAKLWEPVYRPYRRKV